MTEVGTPLFANQTPAYQIMEGRLGVDGMAMLDEQLRLWRTLNERPLHSPLRDSLAAGSVSLPAGTLVHGMGMHSLYDPQTLASVAELGIVSGELIGHVEDSETHGCADFFKVPTEMTVGQYIDFTKTPIEGVVRASRGERLLARGMAFIVDPNAEGMPALMQRDGYTDPAMQSFVRPPRGRTTEDTAAILGGVPRGAIAGIIVNEKLLVRPEVQLTLQKLFPDTPILDHTGQLH